MTELEAARAAVLLLRNDGRVIYHRPSGDDWPRRGSFFCDWCGLTVPMTDMRSDGGTCGWEDEKYAWSPSGKYVHVQCWEVLEETRTGDLS